MIIRLLEALMVLLILSSVAYHAACLFAARRFFSRPAPPSPPVIETPPVTILVPLCGVDRGAYENYAALCRQKYPVFQIVFGVQDPLDPSIPVIERLTRDFPGADLKLEIGNELIGENRKVNNLHNMLRHAKHDLLVILDSDVRVGPDFLSKVAPQLSDERVGLVTCFYRAGSAPNWASILEAIGITGAFAPGVLVAHEMEGMKFSLGAVMALSRNKLELIGGLRAVSDYLADDFMLGHLIWKAGFEVRLSPYVVETVDPHVSFRGMIKHQVRWGQAVRVSRPLGHLGLIVTHGTAFALIYAAAFGISMWSLALLGLSAGAQMAVGWLVGWRGLRDRILKEYLWLLPVSDVMGLGVWCMSLMGRQVEWRGKVYRLVDGGKMIPLE